MVVAVSSLRCPECGASRLYRAGMRYLANGETVQRYLCRNCGYRFSENAFKEWYFKKRHKVIGRDRATDILKILDSVGLIVEQPDPIDRRFMRYVLPDTGVTTAEELPPSAVTHISDSKEVKG